MADRPQTGKRGEPDHGHDRHHRRVMAIAAIAVMALLAFMIWVVQIFVAQQKLEKCIATGRRDCLRIEAPPREPPGDSLR